MQLKDAIALLQHKNIDPSVTQTWTDLGCGSGLFTSALASLLQSGSIIYAVDRNLSALNKITSSNKVFIKPIAADFIEDPLDFNELDGILMANSLHYVKDKPAFIHKIISYLKPGGCFLIVEYDTDKPVSTWVPYPVSFQTLTKLFGAADYTSAIKLHEQPSLYNRGNIYSAIVTK
jgi:ubiquinone/menaquinone biosynthesis C-methylase UbiE